MYNVLLNFLNENLSELINTSIVQSSLKTKYLYNTKQSGIYVSQKTKKVLTYYSLANPEMNTRVYKCNTKLRIKDEQSENYLLLFTCACANNGHKLNFPDENTFIIRT